VVTARRGLRGQVALATAALLAATSVLSAWPAAAPARHLPKGLELVRSGLVMQDPLDRGLTRGDLEDTYVLGGSAGPGLGWATETRRGLAVGIKPHRGWLGWFAVTIDAAGPAVAWHVVMTPGRLPPHEPGRGIAVFAVQTATTQRSGVINYIVVAAVSRAGGYRWLVGYAHGIVADASTDVLWASPWQAVAPGGPTLPAKGVTVVTNGHTTASVWIGSREVFSSTRLRLDMPAPFQAYLEVQSSAPAYSARFDDFWVARDAPLEVLGVPAGSDVALSAPGARAGASAVARQGGTAWLAMPSPDLVGTAVLTVSEVRRARGSLARLLLTYRNLEYAGGDVVRVAPG